MHHPSAGLPAATKKPRRTRTNVHQARRPPLDVCPRCSACTRPSKAEQYATFGREVPVGQLHRPAPPATLPDDQRSKPTRLMHFLTRRERLVEPLRRLRARTDSGWNVVAALRPAKHISGAESNFGDDDVAFPRTHRTAQSGDLRDAAGSRIRWSIRVEVPALDRAAGAGPRRQASLGSVKVRYPVRRVGQLACGRNVDDRERNAGGFQCR